MTLKVDVSNAHSVVEAIARLEALTDSSEVASFDSLVEFRNDLEKAIERSSLFRAHYRCPRCNEMWIEEGAAEESSCKACSATGVEPFYFAPVEGVEEDSGQLMSHLIQSIQKNASEPLWTASDVADFLRVSEASVVKSYYYMPNFPKGFRLPSKKGLGSRRWRPEDIKAWCDSQESL